MTRVILKKTTTERPPKSSRGGYRDLQSHQMSEIVYDGTVVFCDRFISHRSRTHDQMVQAARRETASHAFGVTEGRMASGTYKETEL